MRKMTYDIINAGDRNRFLANGKIVSNSSRGVQIANLPRGTLKIEGEQQYRAMLDAIARGEWQGLKEFGDPMDVLSSCVRGVIAAPEGYKFLVSDFSNIEGRLAAWLAGEQWKLDAFAAFDRGEGPDIYNLSYAKAFNISVDQITKDQRQVGKVIELSLGYSGWVGAFHSMAKNYGVSMGDDEAKELIIKWRDLHPNLVKLWANLTNAAKMAIVKRTRVPVNDKIYYEYDQKSNFLKAGLPSPGGKCLHYYSPRLSSGRTPWGKPTQTISYLASKGGGKPFRMDMWPGVFIENLCQAIARELLEDAKLRLNARGFDVRLSTYDEIMAMVPLDHPTLTLEEFEKEMARVPDWAAGLPLACAGFECFNYRKD